MSLVLITHSSSILFLRSRVWNDRVLNKDSVNSYSDVAITLCPVDQDGLHLFTQHTSIETESNQWALHLYQLNVINSSQNGL